MGKLALGAIALCISAAFVLPAFAQGGDKDKPVATLEVNKGVVMTSQGGEYLKGNTGQQLFSDERLMVTQDGSATVVYSDHCKRTYDTPGVYKIDANCKGAVWFNSAGVVAGIASGVIAIGVIAHNINDHGHNEPISR